MEEMFTVCNRHLNHRENEEISLEIQSDISLMRKQSIDIDHCKKSLVRNERV